MSVTLLPSSAVICIVLSISAVAVVLIKNRSSDTAIVIGESKFNKNKQETQSTSRFQPAVASVSIDLYPSQSTKSCSNMLIARTGGLSRVLTSSFLLPPSRSSVPVTLQQDEVTTQASMSTASQTPESGRYEPGQHSIAYVTTPNENSAKELARKLVEHKLAACVNIIPGLTSVYEWEGKLNEDHETLLMIKTRTTRVDELAKFVRENHPYSVAEVISVPIENGNPPYLEWLSRSVPEKK